MEKSQNIKFQEGVASTHFNNTRVIEQSSGERIVPKHQKRHCQNCNCLIQGDAISNDCQLCDQIRKICPYLTQNYCLKCYHIKHQQIIQSNNKEIKYHNIFDIPHQHYPRIVNPRQFDYDHNLRYSVIQNKNHQVRQSSFDMHHHHHRHHFYVPQRQQIIYYPIIHNRYYAVQKITNPESTSAQKSKRRRRGIQNLSSIKSKMRLSDLNPIQISQFMGNIQGKNLLTPIQLRQYRESMR